VFITFHCREDGWRESRGLKMNKVRKYIEKEGESKKQSQTKMKSGKQVKFRPLKNSSRECSE
jgi:hypothetical protein